MIVITHDRTSWISVTSHTMGIHRRRIRKIEGGTEKLYAQLLMEEELHERTGSTTRKKRAEVERFITRFRRRPPRRGRRAVKDKGPSEA
jgi:ATP-binding cassette subfamily F protein 3